MAVGYHPAMRSRLHLALGLFGVLNIVLGLLLWWRVMTSPGDDNPMGLVGLMAAALGTVPTWGLLLWLERRPLRDHPIWLACALVAAFPLGVFCLLFASMWLR